MMLRNILNKFSPASAFSRHLSTQIPLVCVEVSDKTGITTVTMQKPPVCSINLELASALLTTFRDLEANKCRGVILTSALPTIFSAGLDILEMHQPDPARFKDFWTTLQDLWITLYGSSYPTAAAINGHSPAGGCLLACSCEYRVMVRKAEKPYTIGLNETQLGITAPQWFIDTYRNTLPNRVAESALIAGKLFPTDEALAIGLIDDVAEDKADAIAKAEKWLSQFSRISPVARGMTKRALRRGPLETLVKTKQADLDHVTKFVFADKTQKYLSAYLESLKKKN